jgi:hypothetical protein
MGRSGAGRFGKTGGAGLTSSTEEARRVMADVTRAQRARRDLAVQNKDRLFVEQNAEEIG